MALNKTGRALSLLLVVGTVCLLYGLGFSYIEQNFSKWLLLCSLLGLISLIICFVVIRKLSRRSSGVFQWKQYGMIILLVVVATTSFLAMNYFAYKLGGRLDLTQAKQHTLTKNTASLIKGLEQEVQFTAFYVGMPPKYLEDLFKEYERVSGGGIKTEIIDPLVRISYAAQFGSVIDSRQNKVIVRSGTDPEERRDIDFTESVLTEEKLNNAIIRVTREARIIYFLNGHGEYNILDEKDNGLSILAKLLAANNIESKNLMLEIEGGIPEDCDVLVVAGPHQLLLDKEEKMIEEYLEEGGDALFLVEHTVVTTLEKPLTKAEKKLNPSLNSILNNWGLEVAADVVIDIDSHVGQDVGSPITRNYVVHKAITQNLDYTFYVRPRSISVLEDRRESLKVAPIVFTASKSSSWGETDKTLNVKFDELSDTPGPVPIAYVVFEAKDEDKSSDSRLIVFTDADFLSNVFIGQYSNAAMGLNVIKWLTESDYQVFIDENEIKIERLYLTNKQKRAVTVVLFVIPILICLSGVLTWMNQAR